MHQVSTQSPRRCRAALAVLFVFTLPIGVFCFDRPRPLPRKRPVSPAFSTSNDPVSTSVEISSTNGDGDIRSRSSSSCSNAFQKRSSSKSSQQERSLSLTKLAIAGAMSTFVADLAVHPIDCIKTLQQSEEAFSLGIADSIPRAALYLWDTAGLAGFYKGFIFYATMDGLAGACKFGTWEFWKRSFPPGNGLLLAIGSSLAFVASSFFVVPGELVKQQLQMGLYSGLPEAVQGIWSSYGAGGFFTGIEGIYYRDIPYTIMELSFYEVFKSLSKDDASESQLGFRELSCAAATGTLASSLTTPLDTTKTKLVVDAEYFNSSFLDCMWSTLDAHGIQGLFVGVEARVAWIVPFVCIYLPLYDILKQGMLDLEQSVNGN